MDRRGVKPPQGCEEPVTREQLDELEKNLRPVIAKFLEEPEADTTVAITCTPVRDDPDGASVMRFDVMVRGEPISYEQEQRLSQLLRSSDSQKIVKAKPTSV